MLCKPVCCSGKLMIWQDEFEPAQAEIPLDEEMESSLYALDLLGQTVTFNITIVKEPNIREEKSSLDEETKASLVALMHPWRNTLSPNVADESNTNEAEPNTGKSFLISVWLLLMFFRSSSWTHSRWQRRSWG